MNKLSDLQHSLIRFAITVVLYGLYMLMLYYGCKTFFEQKYWANTAVLFFVIATSTFLFHHYMPKRRLEVTVTEG